jgi:hypothetical protein
MTPDDIVTALVRHGARIAVEGERVRLVFNGSPPPDDLIRAAREAKAALREIVASGAPREWTKALTRLDVARPPAEVPEARWRRFIDDCAVFVDTGWAGQAAALGWTPSELFGCDRVKPFARVSSQGLLWLLNGRPLLACTADTAAIASSRGCRLTYYRRPAEPDQVLIWEIVP